MCDFPSSVSDDPLDEPDEEEEEVMSSSTSSSVSTSRSSGIGFGESSALAWPRGDIMSGVPSCDLAWSGFVKTFSSKTGSFVNSSTKARRNNQNLASSRRPHESATSAFHPHSHSVVSPSMRYRSAIYTR